MASITTDPVPNGALHSGPYAMSGKMEYVVDGLNYCEDDNTTNRKANTDCIYDVRLMSNNGDILVFFVLYFTNRIFNPFLYKPFKAHTL